MSNLTVREAQEALQAGVFAMRETIAGLEASATLLGHHHVLESVIMAMKQITDPRDYNVPESIVPPLVDLRDLIDAGLSGLDFMVECSCGTRYMSQDEADLCHDLHGTGAGLHDEDVELTDPIKDQEALMSLGYKFIPMSISTAVPSLAEILGHVTGDEEDDRSCP